MEFQAPLINASGLLEAARRLRNDRLVKVFERFLEQRGATYRVWMQLFLVAWAGLWQYGPQPVLAKDAVAVFPWSVALLGVAVVWWLIVRKGRLAEKPWLDAVGLTMNLVFIAIQINFAFILMIFLNAFLPFLVISAVARYGVRAVKPAVIGTFIVLLVTAPSGYWLSRPAYFVYAVLLTIVFPWMVARMIVAMQEIAYQALSSRDAQSRFISTMSHELRTPLNAIVNCAQLIDRDHLPATEKELMDMVSVNAKALSHRVNEVLDVAAIDGDRMVLREGPVALQEILNTVRAVCTNTASSKGVSFTSKLEAPSSPVLLGDEGRIEQVVTNLVTNAIKFTPPGGVVDLVIEAEPQASSWDVKVTVTDSGIGIPPAQRSQIFNPFTQLSSGASRSEGGVGLGLYIVRSVSDLMEGALRVDANPGGGTIFEWQFTAPSSGAAFTGSTDIKHLLEAHKQAHPGVHCLVFEDMETNRHVIRHLLEAAGHRVTFFEDGRDAVGRIRSTNPNIVFMDLHMPGTSGWGALEAIQDATATLPAIYVLSADMRPASIAQAKLLGAAGYLSKPIDAAALLDAITRDARAAPVLDGA